MSRYIDIEPILEWCDNPEVFEPYGVNSAELVRKIRQAPSIDIEPKRGEWIWDEDAVDWNLGAWICSNCHARNDNIPHSERTIPLRWSGSKFCPNCGCAMTKESE